MHESERRQGILSDWHHSIKSAKLRLLKEPDVEVAPGVIPLQVDVQSLHFFPNRSGRESSGGNGGGRGGRGNWRGRYCRLPERLSSGGKDLSSEN